MRYPRILLAALPFAILTGSPASAATTDAPIRQITVNGEAEVKVAPDQVILSLAVETNDKDVVVAKQANDDRVKRVLALTTTFKIEPKHVQTDQITIEARYDNNYQVNRSFLGYFVRKQIVICLKDLPRFEEFLTAVIKAGTNNVTGIEFQSTELRKYRDQARTMAVTAAKEKAEALAGQLGQKIGRPISISESTGYWYGQRSAYQNQTQNAVASGGGEGESDPSSGFAPGQIPVHANVNVVFELQ